MVIPQITFPAENVVHFLWTLTQAEPIGAPIPERFADFRDRSVHFSGVFDLATVVWEGSNHVGASPTYRTLTDPQGTAISTTAELIEQVLELTLLQRPRASGGGVTQSVLVSAFLIRSHMPRK